MIKIKEESFCEYYRAFLLISRKMAEIQLRGSQKIMGVLGAEKWSIVRKRRRKP
ncbi:hypothetical protein [Phytobacter ursingii]|uniref:Uncharacterized protein n=1 Tax=Phytobacter ursingii TaxID=1972431 RepID=A0AB35RRP9_9ENTR|nr:hypothetical protein [Phytobacter ursingii]MDV2864074.1 hypothetical protein [Phytobacter ursingii]